MALQSRLFKGHPALEACLIDHAAHICEGASGEHVSRIQTALYAIDKLQVLAEELRAAQYGKSTGAAVLAYKQRRQIINHDYQRQADNIVGKMTIASLDQEMLQKESAPIRRPNRQDYGMGC